MFYIKSLRNNNAFISNFDSVVLQMTNSTSSKFDGNDIDDDELLAACDDTPVKISDTAVPTSKFSRKPFLLK